MLFVQSASVCLELVAEPALHDRHMWAQAEPACSGMMPRVPEAAGEGPMLWGGRPGADKMKPALPRELAGCSMEKMWVEIPVTPANIDVGHREGHRQG